MPISAEELAQWERNKARLRREERRPKQPKPAWQAQQDAKERARIKALKDADLVYYYDPGTFIVIR